MNPIPELIPMLKQLRLSGILDSLEVRNRQAIEEKFAYTDFLAMLIQDEVARRTQRKLTMAVVRRANFRSHKTMEEFDFSFNPKINRAQVLDLATCRFMEEKACILIAGPCGTGKSHLAQDLATVPSVLAITCCFSHRQKSLDNSTPPVPPTPMIGV